MKNVLAATTLAATLIAGAAAPSYAATKNSSVTYSINQGAAITDSATFNLGGSQGTVETGSFVDYYNFVLGTTAQVTAASITNTFAKVSQKITSFTVSLYQGTSTSIGSLLASNVALIFPSVRATSGSEFGAIESDNLGTGNYVLKVTGNTTSASYGGSLAISAVPLPSTVALFGVALAGLGVAGAMRRKSAASAV